MSTNSQGLSTRARWNPLAMIRGQAATLAVFLLLIIAVLGTAQPAFLAPQNIRDVLINASYPAIAAIGMTMVIVSGEIDISVGSILAVCAVLAGNLAQAGAPMLVVIVAALLAGALLGMLNGALVAWARIPSIIVTLGALSFWRGLVIYLTQGTWIQNLPDAFYFAQRSVLGVPVPIWLMAVLVAAGILWMHYSPLGRELYAVGGNRQAALLAGVPVRRRVFLVLMLNGVCAALAALIYASRFSVIQSNAGLGFEFQVITAVVVGGTSIMGGTGTILGSLLGCLLVSVIGTGLTFLKVSPYWMQAVQGALILLAVVADVLRRQQAAR